LAAASDVELGGRLRLAITRTARRLRQEAGTDLSPSQVAALATIECHGPLAPSEVAERERIRRPTATRVLARLVEAGLVERIPDPADRRAKLVRATARGSEVYATAREAIADIEREWTARLGATKMRELRELLQELNERVAARDAEA